MPDLPTRLAYEPNGNGFELIDPDWPDINCGMGEIKREDVAREIVWRWNNVQNNHVIAAPDPGVEEAS